MSKLIEDLAQRQAALNPRKSFIVQAPAGSGKTALLIQRYLLLLTRANSPDEILAITFTKKAAAEMRQRILQALKLSESDNNSQDAYVNETRALAQEVLKRDRMLNWNILYNPNQLRIQTIDSLCAFITKHLPLLANYGASPNINEDPEQLYLEAIEALLSHLEENVSWAHEIGKLLLHLDNDYHKVTKLLMNLLAKRDQWLPYIHLEQEDRMQAILEKQLAMVISQSLEKVSNNFPNELRAELIALICNAANQLKMQGIHSPLLACINLSEFPNGDINQQAVWLGITNLLLTKSYTWRKSFNKNIGFPPASSTKEIAEKKILQTWLTRMQAFMEKINDNQDLKESLIEIFHLPKPTYNAIQWQILKSLLVILKILCAELRLVFQRYKQIDFIENTLSALQALSHEPPTDLALLLDYQIKHILMDEFQDTSFTQFKLLEKLTTGWEENDGRTLFIVGDPMQSIYRFREAEVGLFLQVQLYGIGNIKLQKLTLNTNFRSTKLIVDWVNAHFNKIFPDRDQIESGAVIYHPSIAFNQSGDTNSEIKISSFMIDEKRALANSLCDIAKHHNQTYPNEKLAILVRSRSHLLEIIAIFKKHQISYQALDIDPLADKQYILDLFSLTKALMHLGDRLSWFAILRAPWLGLMLNDLLIISGENPETCIWQQLNDTTVIERLSLEGQSRIKKIVPILNSRINNRDRFNLRKLVEETWLALGGPACLDNENELVDCKTYFKLLEQIAQTEFYFEPTFLQKKLNQLYATPIPGEHVIQIMTMHSAKGLEFDTVIIPHLERKGNRDEHALLLWMEQPINKNQNALLLAPLHSTGNQSDPIYDFIARKHKQKLDYETDRLLYVAATRAKKRLYLFFNLKQDINNDIEKPTSNSFLYKLWPHIQGQYDLKQSEINSENSKIPQTKLLKRLMTNWLNPYKIDRDTTISKYENDNQFHIPIETKQQIGIVIHRILQIISLKSDHWWESHFLYHEQWIKQLMQHNGLDPKKEVAAYERIQQTIKTALQDERCLWLLTPHLEAQSEYKLTAKIQQEIKNLVIDRTFIDSTGIRWIIDYKTAVFDLAETEAILEREFKIYQNQLYQYFIAFKAIEKRPIYLGLYYPSIPAWQEWNGEEIFSHTKEDMNLIF